MNLLAIDYGTKNIGLAYSQHGIITTLPAIKNNPQLFSHLQDLIKQYQITKIYVGISEGFMAKRSQDFVNQLREMVNLTVETVEEAVSTIEATDIYHQNQGARRHLKQKIDSVAAAVILNRVIN